MRYVGIAVTRLSIAAGLCLLCIFFVDGPVARLFSESVLHLDQRKYAVGSPVLLVPLTALAAFLVFWGRRARRTPAQRAIILAAVSGLVAFATNNLVFKPLFGRRSIDEFLYWPSHYGFYFFKGDWHTNFPSGHMALVIAIATIGWREFPSLRWLTAVAVALASFLLLFGEWHFVSDLIAGACWGNLVALTVVALSERLATGAARRSVDDKSWPAASSLARLLDLLSGGERPQALAAIALIALCVKRKMRW